MVRSILNVRDRTLYVSQLKFCKSPTGPGAQGSWVNGENLRKLLDGVFVVVDLQRKVGGVTDRSARQTDGRMVQL